MKAYITSWVMLACLTLAVLISAGCLSTVQRDQVLLDLATAKASVELLYPPGPTRDKWLAELDRVTTVEQLIQVQQKAREAATTQPVK